MYSKTNTDNSELHLLESIYSAMEEENNHALDSQRALAQTAGLSLGLTNALLKRFIERGWVKLLHINEQKMKYALTPSGVQEIAIRTVEYFVRAARNSSLYRKKIDVFVEEMVRQSYGALLLLGPVELDFLFDYTCIKHGLRFFKNFRTCAQEVHTGRLTWAKLVVICADSIPGYLCVASDSNEEMKQQIGLPAFVPIIKFSQILLNTDMEKLQLHE